MRRKLSSAALFAIAVATLALSLLASRLADDLEGPLSLALSLSAIALVVGSLTAVYLHWKRLDEAARDAHKTAWYWGGSAGLTVGGGVIGFLAAGPKIDLAPYALLPGDGGLMISGAVYLMAAQFVGYVLVWAWWWWSRR